MSESHQKLRVLFICTQNKVRSLTAEHLYRVRADLEVRSCGTAAFAKNQLTEEVMKWADMVFIFDELQADAIEKKFGKDVFGKEIISLGLADVYQYKSESLVLKLTAKIEPYLGRPSAKSAVIKRRPAPVAKPASSGTTRFYKKGSRSLMSKLLSAVGVKKKIRKSAE
jgi:predicted protein tyrosine phosphatase